MRNLFLIFTLFLTVLSVNAHSTEASKFVEEQYNEKYSVKPKINVLKEHTEEYEQKIGETVVPAITYGYGSMKIKGERRSRMSYICLLDKDFKPIWSCIIPR